jgi:hypothetical protein
MEPEAADLARTGEGAMEITMAMKMLRSLVFCVLHREAPSHSCHKGMYEREHC